MIAATRLVGTLLACWLVVACSGAAAVTGDGAPDDAGGNVVISDPAAANGAAWGSDSGEPSATTDGAAASNDAGHVSPDAGMSVVDSGSSPPPVDSGSPPPACAGYTRWEVQPGTCLVMSGGTQVLLDGAGAPQCSMPVAVSCATVTAVASVIVIYASDMVVGAPRGVLSAPGGKCPQHC